MKTAIQHQVAIVPTNALTSAIIAFVVDITAIIVVLTAATVTFVVLAVFCAVLSAVFEVC